MGLYIGKYKDKFVVNETISDWFYVLNNKLEVIDNFNGDFDEAKEYGYEITSEHRDIYNNWKDDVMIPKYDEILKIVREYIDK